MPKGGCVGARCLQQAGYKEFWKKRLAFHVGTLLGPFQQEMTLLRVAQHLPLAAANGHDA